MKYARNLNFIIFPKTLSHFTSTKGDGFSLILNLYYRKNNPNHLLFGITSLKLTLQIVEILSMKDTLLLPFVLYISSINGSRREGKISGDYWSFNVLLE